MSNDAKLWVVRGGLAGFILLDLYFIGRIQSGDPGRWFALLMVSIIISLPLFVLHSYFHARRWTHDDANLKTSTETLAKLGQKQMDEKHRRK
jgi:hypothetical protein